MTARNLEPGQYQIGDFVFGQGTLFNVEGFDIGAYDVNVQDFQLPGSDELRFGSDTLKPMPIQITINARKNFVLSNIAGLIGSPSAETLNFENDRRPGQLAKEWRADDIRGKWGELKPLRICREVDGRTVLVYGRPGKLAVPPLGHKGQNQKIIAEYRRSDTLCYSDFEWYVNLPQSEVLTLVKSEDFDMGNAPSWLRFLIFGPMKHPIIQLGDLIIELDIELAAGEVVELSSYPWQRRCIRINDGISLNARLLRPYLDKLSFDTNSGCEISWTATDLALENSEVFSTDNGTWTENVWPATLFESIEYSGPGAGTMTVKQLPLSPSKAISWADSGSDWRWATTLLKQQSLTPYQHIETLIARPAENNLTIDDPVNRIIGRSNNDKSEYLYWDITFNYAWFGYHKDGTDHVLSKRYSIDRLLQELKSLVDNAFELDFSNALRPSDNWWYGADFGSGTGYFGSDLYINGYRIASYKGGADLPITFGGTRYGLGMKATNRALGQATPGPVKKMKMWDNPPENWNPKEWDSTYELSGRIVMLWRDAWQTI